MRQFFDLELEFFFPQYPTTYFSHREISYLGKGLVYTENSI